MSIKEVLNNTKSIAVVGMSIHPSKPAHTVPLYMKKRGYSVIPVNPNRETVAKLKSYSHLADIEEEIDMVNIFRPSSDTLEIVKEAVERHKTKGDVKYIWLQLGIINEEAKKLATESGIEFIQDKCLYAEHKALD